jgi:hypothetical protein
MVGGRAHSGKRRPVFAPAVTVCSFDVFRFLATIADSLVSHALS